MSATILGVATSVALALLALSMGLCALRMIRGPRAHDRVLALDAMSVYALLIVMVAGLRAGTSIYFEAALILALIGFVATIVLARFLLRGEVIE